MKKLSIIVPCYNEEQSLPFFFSAMEEIHNRLPLDFEYLFVDDGSSDGTLRVLRELENQYPRRVHYLSFSRNFGKEAAIYAGLQASTGDYLTLMDADLQDPPELLVEMYEKIQQPDVDCVAARRSDRQGEPVLRSFFSRLFYRIMNRISSTPVIDGVRDFRLMTRQMADSILELSEYNRFSKGLLTWVGYRTEYVAYQNRERIAGKTSWSFWSLLRYSVDGFINFSEAPLNIATYSGVISTFLSVLVILFLIVRQLFFHRSASGWTSMTVIIIFCFGFTLLMLGVIGKYISKIFLETKRRPIYIVKEKK